MTYTKLYAGGLTNPAPGVFDFEDWRALEPIFDAAKQTGIFVVLRPGTCPYPRCYDITLTISPLLQGLM